MKLTLTPKTKVLFNDFNRLVLALIAILFLAMFLRLTGNRFGLPYEYHPDEVQYVRQAASMGENGLQPVWWNNPPFFKYLLLAEFGALFAVGRIAGWYESLAQFGANLVLDPTPLYLIGRTTSAIFGTLTVVVVFFIGLNARDRRVGLIAAWFLAVSFLHVRDSHFAVNDIAVTFFVTVALLAAIFITTDGSRKWYVLAGVSLGVGISTKYSAIVVVVPIVIGHFLSGNFQLSERRIGIGKLLVAASMTLIAAVIASPYFVVVPGIVVRDAYEALYLAAREGFDGWQLDPDGGYLYYLKTLILGLGLPLALLGFAGLGYSIISRRRELIVLASLPIFWYLIAGRQNMYFARFILPVLPTILVLSAIFLVFLVERVTVKHQKQVLIMIVSSLLVALPTFVHSIRYDYLLTKIDTRTEAKAWIEANIPAGSSVAVDWRFYGPPLSSADTPTADSKSQYEILVTGGHGLPDKPLSWYREQRIDFLISSSFIADLNVADVSEQERREQFYASLDDELVLVQRFGVRERPLSRIKFDDIYGPLSDLGQRRRPGPELRIYRFE